MQLKALIFALITLIFSTTPCCPMEDGHGESEVVSTCESETEFPDSEGPCSPFYTCGTCGGCIFEFAAPYPLPSVITNPKELINTEYKHLVLEIVPNRLLRPPIEEFS